MSEWSQEHTATLSYQTTYFSELNPSRIAMMLAHHGTRARADLVNACELGYGTGLSTVIHASASDIRWWGTDYNPSHAQYANDLAQRSKLPVELDDQSFQTFCSRTDLPDFDFIALHGVWSWVSDANREIILDFLKRKLRWGGVVYISYNTLPGHAHMVPFRNLMKTYMDSMTASGQGDLERGRLAYQFVQGLLDSNPALAAVFPLAKRAVDALAGYQHTSYTNHEYLVQHWTPMSFCDVCEPLQGARLKFAGSAIPTHHFDDHFLIASQQSFLAAIPDFSTRETARDLLINRQFRQDYWIKGGLQMTPSQAQEALLGTPIVLVHTVASVSTAIAQAVFNPSIDDATHKAIVAVLADFLPHTVADVLAQTEQAKLPRDGVLRAIMHLLGNDSIAVAQSDEAAQRLAPRVQGLNAVLCGQALHHGEVTHLASSVTAGGIRVSQLHMQFLAFRFAGMLTPQQWAQTLAAQLQQAGAHLVSTTGPIQSLPDMVAHITALATAFEAQELPLLQKLKCVP